MFIFYSSSSHFQIFNTKQQQGIYLKTGISLFTVNCGNHLWLCNTFKSKVTLSF